MANLPFRLKGIIFSVLASNYTRELATNLAVDLLDIRVSALISCRFCQKKYHQVEKMRV